MSWTYRWARRYVDVARRQGFTGRYGSLTEVATQGIELWTSKISISTVRS